MLEIEPFELHSVVTGSIRLDGGAMFGVVPKVLWDRKLPADEQNRVTLGLNCLLVTAADGKRVLVDTGMGSRWREEERARWRVRAWIGGGRRVLKNSDFM